MNRLQVQLIVRLDRNKPHVLPLHGFSDRFGIHEVVLVRLHEWLHKLRRDQSNVVALLPQCPSEEVRSRTGFQADQRSLHVRCVRQQLELQPKMKKLVMIMGGGLYRAGALEQTFNAFNTMDGPQALIALIKKMLD
jgi:hypothetical protein